MTSMDLREQISRIDRGTIDFAQVGVPSLRKAVNQPGIGILACAAFSEISGPGYLSEQSPQPWH